MTAETLKPFITPQSVDSFPLTHTGSTKQQHRNSNLLAIGLSVTALVLTAVVLGFAVWSTVRISNLEVEIRTLNITVESMKKRLGLDYLEDLNEFMKEYTNAFIDDPNSLDDVDDDDDSEDSSLGSSSDDDEDMDEDEDVDLSSRRNNNNDNDDDEDEDDDEDDSGGYNLTYDDLISLHRNYEDLSDEENAYDDYLYDDFEKYMESKKKKKESSRKARSIAPASKEHSLNNDSHLSEENKTSTNVEEKSKDLLNQSKQSPQTTSTRAHSTDSSDSHGRRNKQKHHFVAEHTEGRRSPLRHRAHRRHKFPLVKSGESLISAKSSGYSHLASAAPAAHFHLNRKVSDRHSPIKVDSYSGDMYIGHPSSSSEMDYYFKVENGILIVREPGLYYVYAQVCYNNSHDQNGFVIFHGHKPFLQCLNTIPTNLPLKIHTCHTSGLIHLEANETIHLRDFHSDRNVILKDSNNRSYFGLIKI